MADSKTADLDADLRALHGSTQTAQLSQLHEVAAKMAKGRKTRRFHLTHAWVFALVTGDETRIGDLERRLRDLGGL